ncbi:MAG: thioredoxin domain-containing protein [Desulfurococcales archaeon]|nr:thioredoxin domain-containing protein [Desulfurococcales archaeon]
MRLATPKSYTGLSEASILTLGVLLGSLVAFYLLMAGPSSGAEEFYLGSLELKSESSFKAALRSYDKLAAMFSSDTCPVCRSLEPVWRDLASDMEGYRLVIVKLTPLTARLFAEEGVVETPTFIVYVGGDEVARLVGGVRKEYAAEFFRAWLKSALEGRAGAEEVLERACGDCHALEEVVRALSGARGIPESIDLISKAHDGGEVGVEEALKAVAAVATLTWGTGHAEEATRLEVGLPDSLPQVSVVLAALVAGVAAGLSPCVLPILAAYSMASAATGASRILWSLEVLALSALGAAAAAGLFVAAGSAFTTLQAIAPAAAGATLTVAGLLEYAGVASYIYAPWAGRGRRLGYVIYGLLAVQCSLPIVAGAMLAAASGSLIGLASLTAFSLGIALPAAASTLSANLAVKLSRLGSSEARRVLGAIIAAAGLILLASSLGLV